MFKSISSNDKFHDDLYENEFECVSIIPASLTAKIKEGVLTVVLFIDTEEA